MKTQAKADYQVLDFDDFAPEEAERLQRDVQEAEQGYLITPRPEKREKPKSNQVSEKIRAKLA